MALITCPECQKQISNQANSCPHCGYILNSGLNEKQTQKRETKLGEIHKQTGSGILMVLVGIAAIVGGIFTMGIIIGIFAIIGGSALIGLGTNQIHGTQEGTCPYCGNAVSVPTKSTTVKCIDCKKVSSKSDYYLGAIG